MTDTRQRVAHGDLQNQLNDAINAKMKQGGFHAAWGTVSIVPREALAGECNWTFLWENNLTEADDIVTGTIDEFRDRYELAEG